MVLAEPLPKAAAPVRTPALTIAGVTRSFGTRRAVDDVTLSVERGELFALLGPSGSGKSTLLRLIAGFETPDAGTVVVDDRVVAGPRAWVEPDRRAIGLVPQGDTLFPHLSIVDNVAFGVGRNRARALEALELVGLGDRAADAPASLSGGERQRVALARALAPGPRLILLDEPFAALDAGLRGRLRREVVDILRAAGATALLVTHDQEEALGLADRIAIMREGRIVGCGTPTDLYWQPADAWTAGFLGDVNILHADLQGGQARTALGRFCTAAGEGPARIGVRPEQLELRDDADGEAVVSEREFRGHDVMYRLHHPSAGFVLVQLPSVELFALGQRVNVVPHARAVAAVLHD